MGLVHFLDVCFYKVPRLYIGYRIVLRMWVHYSLNPNTVLIVTHIVHVYFTLGTYFVIINTCFKKSWQNSKSTNQKENSMGKQKQEIETGLGKRFPCNELQQKTW